MATKNQLAFAKQVLYAALAAKTEINPSFITAQAIRDGERESSVRLTSSVLPRVASGTVPSSW